MPRENVKALRAREAGVSALSRGSELLGSLAEEYWQGRLREDPLLATALGDRRYDSKLPDISPEARSRREADYLSVLRRCDALADEQLSPKDKVTKAALLVDASSALEFSRCRLEEWALDPLQGPQVEFANVESYQPIRSPAEGRAMVERWVAMGRYIHDYVSSLKRGATEGRVAVDVCVERAIDELKEMLAKPDSEWPFLLPLKVRREGWSEEDSANFGGGIMLAVKDSIRPAYADLLSCLQSEILPRARSQERPGIMHIPGGIEAYRKLIKVHTSLDLSPEGLHRTGLREVDRINAEMETLGCKVLGVRTRKEVLERLRTDPALYFETGDEVAEKAEAALSRAKSAIPAWFGSLPKADCEVVRMGEHEQKHSTIAYYRQPAADGSRPGRYMINTSEPRTRPRYEAEALAYHESIPGHHLQIAIAQELGDIPDFRRNSGVTAFVEGWGLYAERLADEMGLYSSDLDRLGMLSYDAWRACRLVVDTGMHAFGWTRGQSIDFMLENTALAKNNIINEVDRYITWPGQALAYKTGQLEMIRLRRATEAKLGSHFQIKRFHDALLGNGALPLSTLATLTA